MSIEENKAIYLRFIEEVWNKGRPDRLAEFLSVDYVFHGPGAEPVAGVDAYRPRIETYLAAFPDFKVIEENIVAEGDSVACRYTVTGTHKGVLQGMAPTGRAVRVEGFDLVRVADGRIVEGWGLPDMLGLMQQLGVLPAPGETSASPSDGVADAWVKAFLGSGDPDAFAALFAEDGRIVHPLYKEPIVGRAAIRQLHAAVFDGWEQSNLEVLQKIASGDSVAIQWRFGSTQSATHRRVQLDALSVLRLDSTGKIFEERRYFDLFLHDPNPDLIYRAGMREP